MHQCADEAPGGAERTVAMEQQFCLVLLLLLTCHLVWQIKKLTCPRVIDSTSVFVLTVILKSNKNMCGLDGWDDMSSYLHIQKAYLLRYVNFDYWVFHFRSLLRGIDIFIKSLVICSCLLAALVYLPRYVDLLTWQLTFELCTFSASVTLAAKTLLLSVKTVWHSVYLLWSILCLDYLFFYFFIMISYTKYIEQTSKKIKNKKKIIIKMHLHYTVYSRHYTIL